MKDAILRAEELRKEGKKVILERKNDLCSKADYERFAKEHRSVEFFISSINKIEQKKGNKRP